MKPSAEDEQSIRKVVDMYFTGTYNGKEEELRCAFHPDARIIGSINGNIQDWSLDEFIARVTLRPTAAEKNEKYDKEILLIDIANHTAMVKTRVVAGGFHFIDYITLLKIDGHWIIRFKSFTT